jgi:hypothetical protein
MSAIARGSTSGRTSILSIAALAGITIGSQCGINVHSMNAAPVAIALVKTTQFPRGTGSDHTDGFALLPIRASFRWDL